MIRNSSRTRKRLLLFTLFAIAALIASAGVAAGAQAASADGTVATTAVAQDDPDTEWLEVTKEYRQAPDEEGKVHVEYTVENPEILDRPGVQEVRLDYSNLMNCGRYCRNASDDLISHDNVEELDGRVLRLREGVDDATLTFYDDVDNDNSRDGYAERDGTVSQVLPDQYNGGDTIEVEADTTGSTTVEPAFTYETANDGFVTSGNSQEVARLQYEELSQTPYVPLIVMGDYELHDATVDGNTVNVVVPADVEPRADPEQTAQALAETAAQIDSGFTDGPWYVLVHDEIEAGLFSPKGQTRADRSRWVQVRSEQPLYATWSTWAEELAHTTDHVSYETDGSVRSGSGAGSGAIAGGVDLGWLHEGYAVYRAMETSFETGYGSYDDFAAHMEYATRTGEERPDAESDFSDYYFGPLLMHALDYRLRQASGGDVTIEDYHGEIANYGGANDSQIVSVVDELSNDPTLDDDVDAWLDDEATPQPLTLSEYQDVYGPVPNVSADVTSIEVSSDWGTETVDTDRPLAVREGSTVEFELGVENDGSASGHYRLELRDADANPHEGEPPAVHDQVEGTIAGQSTETVTLTTTFDEQGTYHVDVGEVVPTNSTPVIDGEKLADPYNVTVVPQDAAIVRDNGGDGEHGLDEVVTNETSTIVYQGDTTDEYLSASRRSGFFTNEHGVREFDPESWADPGEDNCLAFALYGEWRCVASLPPVNGTVPADIDDDGDYMDMNADGTITEADTEIYFDNHLNDVLTDYLPAYDFDDDGDIDHADTITLSNEADS